MERIFYLEIELKRAKSTLKRVQRHSGGFGMVNTLKTYITQLEVEKRYYYSLMMKQKTY